MAFGQITAGKAMAIITALQQIEGHNFSIQHA